MASRLTVLGSCGAWPEPGRACSGFLLEHDDFRIVLDLGYATLPRLLDALGNVSADGLDAVVITHRHADHAIDLHGLMRARWFGGGGRETPALPLFAPDGVLEQVAAFEEDGTRVLDHVFDRHPIPASDYEVGPFRLQSWSLPHFVVNAGVRLSAGGVTVAYTGDTGPTPALADVGRKADLFIVEASDRTQQGVDRPVPAGRSLHLNAQEAGLAAAAADARRLMLTHFWPGNDRRRSRDAAAANFDGDIIIATEGLTVELR